jgi:hypothetical protein
MMGCGFNFTLISSKAEILFTQFFKTILDSSDVMTLKRGGWSVTKFSDSPFARRPGPGFFLKLEAVALLIFGAAKIIAAIFQGLRSLVLGVGLFVVSALLLAWQVILRKLFQSRFFERSHQA